MNGRQAGFTLVELVVSMLLFGIILAAVFDFTNSSMNLYRTDQSRIGVNRNARSTYDVLGNDIRQAGERLSQDFPAITVTQGTAGTSILTVRRGLTDTPMPVCSRLVSGTTTVYVNAIATNPSKANLSDGSSNLPAACSPSAQDMSNFAAQFAAGNFAGYIYDVKAGTGSWVKVTGTNATTQTITISGLTTSYDPRRTSTSDLGRDIRLYLLEERRYALNSNTLTMAQNNEAAAAASPNVQAFVVQPYTNGNPPVASTLPFPSGTLTWRDIAYLDVTLTLRERHGNQTVQRTVTERYSPRNALSGE